MIERRGFGPQPATLGWNAESTATAMDCAPEGLDKTIVLVPDA